MASNLKSLELQYDDGVQIIWNERLLRSSGTGLEVISLTGYGHGEIEPIPLEAFLSILKNNSELMKSLSLSGIKFKSPESSFLSLDTSFLQLKTLNLYEVQDSERLVDLFSQASTPSFSTLALQSSKTKDGYQLDVLYNFLKSTRSTIQEISLCNLKVNTNESRTPKDLWMHFPVLKTLKLHNCSELLELSKKWTCPQLEEEEEGEH